MKTSPFNNNLIISNRQIALYFKKTLNFKKRSLNSNSGKEEDKTMNVVKNNNKLELLKLRMIKLLKESIDQGELTFKKSFCAKLKVVKANIHQK
jgi:hypothetical protein